MHMADPPASALPGKKMYKPESRGQYLNGLEKLIFPMYFLKADDVVVFDTSAETLMYLFPVNLRESHRPSKNSNIPSSASKTNIRNMDTCVPVQGNSLYLRWLKSIPPPTWMRESWESAFWVFVIGIFMGR